MSVDFWNDRFAAEGYAYGREPNDFVRAEAGRIPKGRVLCLAEGQGRNAVFLAGLGHEVTAVDFSVEGLRKAEALAKERGVEIKTVHADLATYDLELDVFTGIVSVFAHLPPDLRKRVHAQVPRALKVGGAFVLEAYSPAQLAYETGGPKDVQLLMTLAGLRDELAPLSFHVGQEIERDIHEGPWHGGRSATVQVVAVREA